MKARISLLSLSLLIACGDPLADGTYRGEPLATLYGRTAGDAGTSSIAHPHVAIVWFNFLSDQIRGLQVMAPIEAGPLSRDFALQIWDAPPPETLAELCDGTRMTIGFAIAVDDVNGDGAVAIDFETGDLEAPDLTFGFAARNAIVYLERVGSKECEGVPMDIDFGDGRSLFVTGLDACGFTTPAEGGLLSVHLFPPTSRIPEVEEVECEDLSFTP